MGATYPALSNVVKREQINENSLLYTWPGSDPTSPPILLISHLDIPAPDPAPGGSNAALFAGAVKGDAVWGRGAQLGKGPLVAMLEAGNALAAGGFKPRRTIIFAFGQDGDVSGQAGAAQIARVLAARKLKAWFALDEGPPIVAKNVLTGKMTALIGVTEKRDLDLIVTAAAAGGASSVRGGAQAVTAVAQAVVALDAMPNASSLSDEPTHSMVRALAHDLTFPQAFVVANSWLFEPLIMVQMRNSPGAADLLSTTVSPTVIAGGANRFLRPTEAVATVNVRLHPRDTPAQFLSRARAAVSPFPGVSLDWAEQPGERITIASDKSDAYHLIESIAAAASNNATVAPSLYIGSTDARHYTSAARDVYRFTPAIWTESDIINVMSAKEHISTGNLVRMIGFYQDLLGEAAG